MTVRHLLDMIDRERLSRAEAIRRLHDPNWDTYLADEINGHQKAIARLDKFRAGVITAAQKVQRLQEANGEGKCRKKKRTAA